MREQPFHPAARRFAPIREADRHAGEACRQQMPANRSAFSGTRIRRTPVAPRLRRGLVAFGFVPLRRKRRMAAVEGA